MIPTTPKCCSSSDGCITRRVATSPVKKKPSSSSRNRSVRIIPMRKVGTFWAAVTCRKPSIPRHTKPTSKQCIATVVTQPFGARLVCFTTRSISTAMHWMPTRVRFGSTRTSPKFGLTWGLFTSLAITRYLMRWMRTVVPLIWIRPTFISRRDCNFCKLNPTVPLLSLGTSILKRIRILPLVLPLNLHGEQFLLQQEGRHLHPLLPLGRSPPGIVASMKSKLKLKLPVQTDLIPVMDPVRVLSSNLARVKSQAEDCPKAPVLPPGCGRPKQVLLALPSTLPATLFLILPTPLPLAMNVLLVALALLLLHAVRCLLVLLQQVKAPPMVLLALLGLCRLINVLSHHPLKLDQFAMNDLPRLDRHIRTRTTTTVLVSLSRMPTVRVSLVERLLRHQRYQLLRPLLVSAKTGLLRL